MPDFKIKKVLVEEGVQDLGPVDSMLRRLHGIPVQPFDGTEIGNISNSLEMGKDTLRLLSYRGVFLKPCPGTSEYICCGYQILNVGTNCPLNCSYCILQSYFNQRDLRVFVNLEKELDHVLRLIDSQPDRVFRVGTGEFMDSLAIDPITCWSDLLLPVFSKRKNTALELKTKTGLVDRLLASSYRDRIVVSWSLNSPFISSREEHRAASLRERLKAARRCQSEGFTLGFHFDPLIPHPRWKEEYLKTLDLMDEYVDPAGIIWISLGSFRFMPGLKTIIRRRHPKTCILNGEFIVGLDGKMRYFKPIRMDLYGFMREHLEKWHPNLGLYLCMESDDVWKESLGWSPGKSSGLGRHLDRRVLEFFG
ncbi:MAG: radical SAM protein [Thermodesulfobacteriota bacterium]|nr:radical SAM protein [Thermodesulfobacteriota bacterium]